MVKENEKEPEKDLTNEVHADKKIGMDDVPELCCQGNRRMEKVFTENDRQDAKERNGSGRKEKKACSGQQDNVQDGCTQAKVNIGDNILEMRTENATIRNDDHNLYGTVNRNMVQGLMDIALLSANANQLRFLLVYNQRSSTYYISLTLVIISLCLQVIVGVLAIFQVN